MMHKELVPRPPPSRFFMLTGLGMLLTMISFLFGAPVFRILHNVYGPRYFWITGVVVSGIFAGLGLHTLALMIGSVWACIGIYGEFELRGRAGHMAAFVSISVATLISLGLPLLLRKWGMVDIIAPLREGLEILLAQMKSQNSNSWFNIKDTSVDKVVYILPAVFFIMYLCSLAFALILDRRMSFLFNLRFERVAKHINLLEFKLPDLAIWITMLSFLLSFVDLHQPVVMIAAQNILAVMLALYFFQGLAVMEVMFLVLRVNPLIRFLLYFILVVNLFFVLSVFGIIDFWVDFRGRIRRIRPSEDHQNNGKKNGEKI